MLLNAAKCQGFWVIKEKIMGGGGAVKLPPPHPDKG